MESSLVQQQRIEAFKEYSAASNLTLSYERFDDLESDINIISFEESSDQPYSLIWRDWIALNVQQPTSTELTEPEITLITDQAIESPFDKLSELQSDDDKVFEIIKHVKSHLRANYREKLATRLEFLFEVAKEEEPDDLAISPDSLKNFIGFLQSFQNFKYPDVVLTPAKNIRAQWRTGPNRHFAIEFLTAGDVYFVIFSPDQKHPEKIIRISGQVSVESLMETAQPHGVLKWSSQ